MEAVLHNQAVSLSRLPGRVGLQASHDWMVSLAGLPDWVRSQVTGCAQKLGEAIGCAPGLPRVTVQASWLSRAEILFCSWLRLLA